MLTEVMKQNADQHEFLLNQICNEGHCNFNSKQSRLRRLKNGVPQGSVLAPLLFNIYTYDLPSMISRKFAYADDLALLHFSGNWKDLEGTLSQDMSTLSAYLQTWRLKLSHTKTVTAAFHLNNQERPNVS